MNRCNRSILSICNQSAGMPKDSKYRTLFSRTLLSLNEDGTVRALKEKWWKTLNVGNCTSGQHIKTSTPELGMDNVGGVFLVLAAGVLVAILMGVLEFLWSVRAVSIEEKITPYEAFRKEILFACKVWITKKPIEANLESASEEEDAESILSETKKDGIRLNSIERFG